LLAAPCKGVLKFYQWAVEKLKFASLKDLQTIITCRNLGNNTIKIYNMM